ncbi:ig-like domain-containing protein [Nephila pilipes]|uniref:Ig-like domain-containing protein n=1 Tax=Nephila pilipes TaxID=299642 RepID=A0A8X6U8B5_NEPPI|nr:ig-like domain-containing protein [Nephila pilipes]
MEDLIKRRSPIRANFTKCFNVLLTAFNEENLNREDIEIKLCSLERISRDLAECDDSIRNALVDAKSEEYDKIEEYREKLDIARIRVKAYIEKLYPISESKVSIIAEKTKLKLPKIELNKFGETPPDTITRRVILSYANRYSKTNTIGFTCPVSLQPKILLQDSWRSKLSWDSEVSTDMKKTFLKWIEDIKILHLVKIPRIFLIGDVSSVSFYVFCDASEPPLVEAVVGGRASLPCNVTLEDNEATLILWYRSDLPNPIYTLDVRKNPLRNAEHFRSVEIESRANFDVATHPPALLLNDVTTDDEDDYRCRVDLRRSRTLILHSRLRVIGEFNFL